LGKEKAGQGISVESGKKEISENGRVDQIGFILAAKEKAEAKSPRETGERSASASSLRKGTHLRLMKGEKQFMTRTDKGGKSGGKEVGKMDGKTASIIRKRGAFETTFRAGKLT